MSTQTNYKKCAHCKKAISPGHQARRVYCSQACKQKAYRERKAREHQARSRYALK